MPFTSFIPSTPVFAPKVDWDTTFSIADELRASEFEPSTVALYIFFLEAGRKLSGIHGRGFNQDVVGHFEIETTASVTGAGGAGVDGSALLSNPLAAGGISSGGGGGAGRPVGPGGASITRGSNTSGVGNPGTATTGGAPGAPDIDMLILIATHQQNFPTEVNNGQDGINLDHVAHIVNDGQIAGGGGGGASWRSNSDSPGYNVSFAGGDLAEEGDGESPGFGGSAGLEGAGITLVNFRGGNFSTITGSGVIIGDINFEF